MDTQLEKNLLERYPLILQDMYGDCKETCMCWGIETGNGWYNLLDMLMGYLQWQTNNNNYPQVIASQIKEKYGGLRFYYSTEGGASEDYDNNISTIIDYVSYLSEHTCEDCGKKGKKRKGSWIVTLCDDCNNNNK